MNTNFKILRENNYLPSIIFFYRKSLFKMFFGAILFNCQPIFIIFLQHILIRTNKAPNFATKIIKLQLNK